MAFIPRKRVLVFAFGATVTVAVIKRVRANRLRAAAAAAAAQTPAPAGPRPDDTPMPEASAAVAAEVEVVLEPDFVAIDLAPAAGVAEFTGDEHAGVALADEPIIVVTAGVAGEPPATRVIDTEPDAELVDDADDAATASGGPLAAPQADASDFAWTAPEIDSFEVDEPAWTAPETLAVEVDEPAWTAPETVAVEVDEPAWTAPETVAVEVDEPAWTACEPAAVEVDEPIWTAPEVENVEDVDAPLIAFDAAEAAADEPIEPMVVGFEPAWTAPAAEGIELDEPRPASSTQPERKDNWAIWAALASMAVEVDTPLWTTLETVGLELDEPLWTALRTADARTDDPSATELAVWTPAAFEQLVWEAPLLLNAAAPVEPVEIDELTWQAAAQIEAVAEQADDHAWASVEPALDVEEFEAEHEVADLVDAAVAPDEVQDLVAELGAEGQIDDGAAVEPVAAEADGDDATAEDDPNYVGPWRRVTDFDPVAEEDSVYEGPRRRASDYDVDRGQRELAAAIAQQHAEEDARRAAAPPRKPIGQIGLNRPSVSIKVLTGPLADE